MIAWDPRVCHEIDLRLFGQGKVHWQEKYKIRVQSLSSLLVNILSFYCTQRLLMIDLRVCHDQSSFGQGRGNC